MRLAVPLLAALLLCPALAAPGAGDVERATTRVAQALDGVLRDCPASFAGIGTSDKKCVGAGGTVEAVRVKLGSALGADLYGVWRSRDEQRSVYNWLRTPGGYVYVRVQPDPDGRAQTLVYLDLPPSSGPGTGAAPRARPRPPPLPRVASAFVVPPRRPPPRPPPRRGPRPRRPRSPPRPPPRPAPPHSRSPGRPPRPPLRPPRAISRPCPSGERCNSRPSGRAAPTWRPCKTA